MFSRCSFLHFVTRGSVGSRRFQTWQHLLGNLGHVVMVSLHSTPPHHTLRIPLFVETVIGATVQKVQELKANCPGRPIILAGLQQGALIAAQVLHLSIYSSVKVTRVDPAALMLND